MGSVQIEIKDGIGVIRLSGPRGNAMNEDLVSDLSSALRTVGGEGQVRAVLLASAHPKLFCPGLDLVSLSEIGRTDMGAFMLNFATLLTDLFALKKPVVAAVNGAAVAGGCLLALTADWRVVKRGASMGLNEVKVGVPLPWSAVLLLKSTVCASAHTAVALLGRNFEGDAAVATGFASEVIEAEAFEGTVAERLAEFAEKDAFSFGVTKGHLRGAAVASMRDREAALLDEFLDGWFSESTQARIQKAVASLKAKA
ncbi:MAG: enoyl-CoA hydratase/isomerase family protein [Vicinamibacteria bacterium]|nr:enoyl-CoA hydratase/isomerase family protein [Vicinamibacteria bacterium]